MTNHKALTLKSQYSGNVTLCQVYDCSDNRVLWAMCVHIPLCTGTASLSVSHSKRDYCNSVYFSLPNSQINRLQQIQNSFARTVVKSPRFSHITLPLSLGIFLNWSLFSLLTVLLFSLLAVLDPRLLSPYPDHLLLHLSKLQTVLFNVQHPTFGMNFFIHPHLGLSLSHRPKYVGSTLSSPPFSPSITPSLFHSRLKTHLLLKFLPP